MPTLTKGHVQAIQFGTYRACVEFAIEYAKKLKTDGVKDHVDLVIWDNDILLGVVEYRVTYARYIALRARDEMKTIVLE